MTEHHLPVAVIRAVLVLGRLETHLRECGPVLLSLVDDVIVAGQPDQASAWSGVPDPDWARCGACGHDVEQHQADGTPTGCLRIDCSCGGFQMTSAGRGPQATAAGMGHTLVDCLDVLTAHHVPLPTPEPLPEGTSGLAVPVGPRGTVTIDYPTKEDTDRRLLVACEGCNYRERFASERAAWWAAYQHSCPPKEGATS
jgi:hypothetical protein